MPLHYDVKDGIAYFTIDNGKLNLFNGAMHEELNKRLHDFDRDDDVKVGIIKGAHEKAFCAGDDIKTDDRASLANPEFWTLNGFVQRNKPIIAAVEGWCLGQGFLYMLILTDIRVATESAKFGFPEIKYGMGGAGGGAQLGKQIPHTLAMYLLLTGDYLSAEKAAEHNLINEIVEPGKLLERAEEIANRISRHPLTAIRTEMQSYYSGMDLSRSEAMSQARALYGWQRTLYEAQAGTIDSKDFGSAEEI